MDLRTAKETVKVLDSIRDGANVRIDGRELYDSREVKFTFERTPGVVVVRWGKTMIRGCVTGEIIVPRKERGNEGEIRLSCRFGGIAGQELQRNARGDESWQTKEVECSSLLTTLIRDSKILDPESLCIIMGEKVWRITVEIDALNNDGNLFDASFIAAIAALKSFRRHEVSAALGDSNDIVVHSADARAPIPLSINQIAVLVSFSQFCGTGRPSKMEDDETNIDEEGEDSSSSDDNDIDALWMLDASRSEEKTSSGFLRVATNKAGDILGVFTMDGAILTAGHYQFLVEKARDQSKNILDSLESALKEDTALRLREQGYINGDNYQEFNKRIL